MNKSPSTNSTTLTTDATTVMPRPTHRVSVRPGIVPQKIMTILGTRPEIIRLACVMRRLDEFADHRLVHTGQNSDYELNEVFFEDLKVRRPDFFLGIRRDSVGTILADVLMKTEEVLAKERPDAVLILGDTNSALAAIVARRMKIPVYHMEAGNRCFDLNVPEELNRRIVDHISDFNLVYTEHARRNLLAEGIHPRKIFLTGSPMREVLEANRAGIASSTILHQLGLTPKQYMVVSMHRAENVDQPQNLRKLLEMLNALCATFEMPVIVSTHPRTRQRLETCLPAEVLEGVRSGASRSSHVHHPTHAPLTSDPRIRFLKPFGFHDYVRLQQDSYCTLSDSGTISEESSILGFPAVTMRNSIERPEAMDSGHIVLTGLDPQTILRSVALAAESAAFDRTQPIAREYDVRNTSSRVVKLILGTAKLSHLWDGIADAA